jgi:RNA polymerase sigma-70 factor (ECF subfamily)
MNDEDGDRAFFCAEIERLTSRLYGTALRLTRSPADAEDLVAETVAKAWAGLAQLDDRGSFEKWILRILANAFVSDRRRAREEPVSGLAGEDCEEPFSLFERLHQPFLLWWSNPEQELLNKLLRENLEQALATLPDGFRMVVVLVEMHGYSYAEAADILGVPVGTVRSRLSRARSLLQRALWAEARAAGLVADEQRKGARD